MEKPIKAAEMASKHKKGRSCDFIFNVMESICYSLSLPLT